MPGLTPWDLGVRLPLGGGPIAAGREQAMESSAADRPFAIALEAAAVEQSLDDALAAALLPESLENPGRSDAAGGDGGQWPLGVSGEQEDGLGQAGVRGQQGIELAGLLELVEPPQGGDDPLSGLAVLPAVRDAREVGAWPGGLGAEDQGVLVFGTP